ncbi:NADP-dependent alcohol dehydrogenase 6-like protein 1 [Fusarium keratoplasticum]|uniref:NADP-dependent alcohol dehydrogenase 6-like protein 1 n=1 Tax=Fusarium keratoplasticum TaxID=1328300 RepID=A0ACC0QP54_9HYPO|nr:NADP-dependent alcohol dehydrogenase 6-like protein 1 [Fusarium keratoplasticum]KAI8661075.1 NADP-dependent alcohol dehydrogenase 6-like protein 1 [Fusarium keratoplasticum]
MRSGWGPAPYPVCVRHEIIGTVERVGSQVEGGLRVGDRVGVGPQSDSCLGRFGDCDRCVTGRENYCQKMVSPYAAKHFNGGNAMGGYALYHRCPSHFVFKIPDGLSSAVAAPQLCAGVTVYSPLKKNGCGPGKTIGIAGVGGLGDIAILFAKALGADKVVAISRGRNKPEDALALGADEFVATEDSNWQQQYYQSLDLIVSTVSSAKVPIGDYFSLLKIEGSLVQAGSPDDGDFVVPGYPLIFSGVKLGGSCIGSPAEIREMLLLAEKSQLKPWIEERPMSQVNQTIVHMISGKAKYRYVMVNDE